MEPVETLSQTDPRGALHRREYSVERPLPTKSAARAAQSRSQRLRMFYFSVASIWGFAIGGGGLAVALVLVGTPAEISSRLLVALVPALLVAVAGGWVTASAYREARNRLRR